MEAPNAQHHPPPDDNTQATSQSVLWQRWIPRSPLEQPWEQCIPVSYMGLLECSPSVTPHVPFFYVSA